MRTHAAVVVRKPERVGNSLHSGVGHTSDLLKSDNTTQPSTPVFSFFIPTLPSCSDACERGRRLPDTEVTHQIKWLLLNKRCSHISVSLAIYDSEFRTEQSGGGTADVWHNTCLSCMDETPLPQSCRVEKAPLACL